MYINEEITIHLEQHKNPVRECDFCQADRPRSKRFNIERLTNRLTKTANSMERVKVLAQLLTVEAEALRGFGKALSGPNEPKPR